MARVEAGVAVTGYRLGVDHTEVPRICVDITGDLHRRLRWRLPPHPLRYAASEGVEIFGLPRGCDTPRGVSINEAFYQSTGRDDDDGYQIARALAGPVLTRLRIVPTEALRHGFAAELLVPRWMIHDLGAELVCDHPHAPGWLVRLQLEAAAAADDRTEDS